MIELLGFSHLSSFSPPEPFTIINGICLTSRTLFYNYRGAGRGLQGLFLAIFSARSKIFVKVQGPGNFTYQGHKKLGENLQGLFFSIKNSQGQII